MNAAIFALICSILWGVGYTIIRFTRVSAYIINCVYGFVLFVANFIAILVTHGFVENNIQDLLQIKQCIGFVLHIVLFTASSFIYMYGYSMSNINPGVYVAVSGSYVAVSFLTSQWFMYMGWLVSLQVNYYFAIPGILFITIGSVLLALA